MKIIKIIGVSFLGLLFVSGCASKAVQTYDYGSNLTGDIHKQGYYNCVNSGGSRNYCSQRHNYRE